MKANVKPIIIVLTVLMASCSSGRKLERMNDQQNTNFQASLSNWAALSSALNGATATGTTKVTETATGNLIQKISEESRKDVLGLNSSAYADSRREQAHTAMQMITEALKKGDCQHQTPDPAVIEKTKIKNETEFWALGHIEVKETITGNHCPLNYEAVSVYQINSSAKRLEWDYHEKVSLNSVEIKKLLDIDNFTLDLHFIGNSSNEREVVATMQITGDIHSQSVGSYKQYAEGTGKGKFDTGYEHLLSGGGEIKFGFDFPDYSAEIKASGSKSGSGSEEFHYFLNNAEVQEKDLNPYLRALTDSMTY